MQKRPYKAYALLFAATMVSYTLSIGPSQAGCVLNVQARNTGTHKLSFHPSDGRVISRYGTWRDMFCGTSACWLPGNYNRNLDPDQRISSTFEATFSCNANRRFRLRYNCKEGPRRDQTFIAYYPSPNGWSTNQSPTIRLDRC